MKLLLLASAALFSFGTSAALAQPASPSNPPAPNPAGATATSPTGGDTGMGSTSTDVNRGTNPGSAMTPPDQANVPSGSTSSGASGSSSGHHHRKHHSSTTEGSGSGNAMNDEDQDSGHWAHQPGTGESGPASARASNIDTADTRSAIAPHLPAPRLGMHAGPEGYLRDADRALAAHRTGEAQQALEMAETRLLDRSAPVDIANRPDQNPRIEHVAAARKALASNDIPAARAAIQAALAGAGENQQGGTGATTGAMTPQASTMAPPANMQGMGDSRYSGVGQTAPGGTVAAGTPTAGQAEGGGPGGQGTQDSSGGAR